MADWFISEEKFKSKVDHQKEVDAVTPWVKIPIGKVYNITKIIEARKDTGQGSEIFHILVLEDRFLDCIKAYAPRRLIRTIRDKRKSTERVFIVCLGQGKYKQQYPINNYDITYEEAGKIIDIFED